MQIVLEVAPERDTKINISTYSWMIQTEYLSDTQEFRAIIDEEALRDLYAQLKKQYSR